MFCENSIEAYCGRGATYAGRLLLPFSRPLPLCDLPDDIIDLASTPSMCAALTRMLHSTSHLFHRTGKAVDLACRTHVFIRGTI